MWTVLLFVGVFNAAFCVENQNDKVFAGKTIKIYSTTEAKPDFVLTQTNFSGSKDNTATIATINANVKHQKIIGFGGTFTDATGTNLNKLSEDVRAKALEALFSDSGIGISLCKVPIGGTEYSSRAYTLDDQDGDITLKQFALQNEDLVDKVNNVKFALRHLKIHILQIPIIKAAQELRKGGLKLLATPWTAPIWMKNEKRWSGYSMLSEKYYQVYAEYLKKFLDVYQEKGINWWGISTGNNPFNGFLTAESNSMGWLPDLQVNISFIIF